MLAERCKSGLEEPLLIIREAIRFQMDEHSEVMATSLVFILTQNIALYSANATLVPRDVEVPRTAFVIVRHRKEVATEIFKTVTLL